MLFIIHYSIRGVVALSNMAAIKGSGAGRMKKQNLLNQIIKNRYIYVLAVPTVIYFIIFKLMPMFGLVIAFQDYSPAKGILGSPFVGFKHFMNLFRNKSFPFIVRNTLVINGLSLTLFFPLPILLSVMLNEVKHSKYKRVIQSILYMPHFMSWVIIGSLTFFIFSSDIGLLNKAFAAFGKDKVLFLTNPNYFWAIITGQSIWREMGWGTILFLAALAGVDVQLYEAAIIDGAGRLKQIVYITIPALIPTIVILFILRIGNMFDVSLEQINLMQNPLVMNVSEVFDTYSYRTGIREGRYSIGAAVGMFKSVIAFFMVYAANKVIKKTGNEGIY